MAEWLDSTASNYVQSMEHKFASFSESRRSTRYDGRRRISGPGYGESFVYDGLGRAQTRTIVTDQSYRFDYAYDALRGQLETLTWPTSTAGVRFKAKYGYTAGYLTSVQDYTGNVNGPVLWTLNLLDARLHASSESYGNLRSHRASSRWEPWWPTR